MGHNRGNIGNQERFSCQSGLHMTLIPALRREAEEAGRSLSVQCKKVPGLQIETLLQKTERGKI